MGDSLDTLYICLLSSIFTLSAQGQMSSSVDAFFHIRYIAYVLTYNYFAGINNKFPYGDRKQNGNRSGYRGRQRAAVMRKRRPHLLCELEFRICSEVSTNFLHRLRNMDSFVCDFLLQITQIQHCTIKVVSQEPDPYNIRRNQPLVNTVSSV